jgi:hypothetical protein
MFKFHGARNNRMAGSAEDEREEQKLAMEK